MGHIVKRRGRKGQARYYGKIKRPDGRWTMRALSGCGTLTQAKEMLSDAERRVRQGEDPFPGPVAPVPLMGVLLTEWTSGLTNASAQADRWRVEKHIKPRFRWAPVDKLDVRGVIDWLNDLKKTDQSPQTQLHQFGTLARFFGWAIERGHVSVNPCRMVPRGRRPRVKVRRDRPWLKGDDEVIAIMKALEPPIDLMFFVGNRCGARQGEVAGLRLSDLGWLAEGTIRVRYSYAKALKEDQADTGAMKWVPAPTDAVEVLGPWLAKRRAEGGEDEELVFTFTPKRTQNKRRVEQWRDWQGFHPHHLQNEWKRAATKFGVSLTWNQATRHSFATRSLVAGASLDEVSASLGHASIETTRRSYDHFIRRQFSDVLRRPLAVPTEKNEGDDQDE